MATKIRTEEELAALLGSMGGTPDAVAAAIRAAGVVGKREEPECCPVANWLFAEVGGTPYVDNDAVSVCFAEDAPAIEVDLPRAVAEFIERFDHFEYPDLEDFAEVDNP